MKKRVIQLIIGGILYAACLIVFAVIGIENAYFEFICYAAAFLVLGYDVLYKAIRNITRGKLFDENFLMATAAVGAFFISEYPEAAAVMMFYQAGEMFQDMAVGRSRKSIAELMNIRPDYALIAINENGQRVTFMSQIGGQTLNMPENILSSDTQKVTPDDVSLGDIIIVRPGEKIPLDGMVINGISTLDTSALSGESRPRTIKAGESVLSGSINLSGVLAIRVDKIFGESTVSKILELVENAGSKKSKSESFITRFAKIYTPMVVILAVLVALVPTLIFGKDFSTWIHRALTFLVVSCPCALVVSVPMSFFGGIGGASRSGILIKGGNYLDALAKVETVVFDKTGTLTVGSFIVSKIHAIGMPEDELLSVAAHAESFSNHPIALSLKHEYINRFNKETDKSIVSEYREISGEGISAAVGGSAVLIGNERLLKSNGIEIDLDTQSQGNKEEGTIVYVTTAGEYKGYILISDQIKPDSADAIVALKKLGIKTVMLTGDRDNVGKAVAKALNIDEVHTQLLPADKVTRIEEIMAKKGKKRTVAFVGDGINDAPVLARADIGIAMGALGSDAAIEAADIVIMNDSPAAIKTSIKIGKKTVGIAMQNIVFAIGIKTIVLALSVFGITNMWMAVFADVGVAFLAILNAMRCLKGRRQS